MACYTSFNHVNNNEGNKRGIIFQQYFSVNNVSVNKILKLKNTFVKGLTE